MEIFVVDTHALVWFLGEDRRLSSLALEILTEAELGNVQVLVPTLVLAELTYISQNKKLKYPVKVSEILDKIDQGDGFTIVSFDLATFEILLTLPQDWEIHDRIIAATAIYYKAKLITRDEILQTSDKINTIWD